MSCLDSTGYDIGPLCVEAATRHDIPLVGLLAMLRAESRLDPFAERWGDRTEDAKAAIDDPGTLQWILAGLSDRGLGLDLSFGMAQITVVTASALGLGDGTLQVNNVLAVREALFERAASIDLGAKYLSGCYERADALDYAAWGISRDLTSLVLYNANTLWPLGDPWWEKWAANLRNYEAALAWAAVAVS